MKKQYMIDGQNDLSIILRIDVSPHVIFYHLSIQWYQLKFSIIRINFIYLKRNVQSLKIMSYNQRHIFSHWQKITQSRSLYSYIKNALNRFKFFLPLRVFIFKCSSWWFCCRQNFFDISCCYWIKLNTFA